MDIGGELLERLTGAQAVVARLAITIFHALHQAGLPHFHVFIQIGAGDGQELDPLEQGIGRILGLFQNTAVELDPGVIAAVEMRDISLCSNHGVLRCVGSLQREAGKNHVAQVNFAARRSKVVRPRGPSLFAGSRGTLAPIALRRTAEKHRKERLPV